LLIRDGFFATAPRVSCVALAKQESPQCVAWGRSGGLRYFIFLALSLSKGNKFVLECARLVKILKGNKKPHRSDEAKFLFDD
jgi:hypothetical protein